MVNTVVVSVRQDGSVYEGDFVNGQRHGHGKYASAGEQYEGSWKDGKYGGGIGTLTWGNGHHCYRGEWWNGMAHGRGCETNPNGEYDGEFSYNYRHGKGIFKWLDGSVYEGEFVNGKRQGQGKYYFSDGGHYEGSWTDGQFDGNGTLTWGDGRCYQG